MTGHVRISLAAWAATVLGALVLTPVFSGPFLFISAFLCGAVTGIGILLQNLRAPRIVVPVVQLVVLVELISLFFLQDTMQWGILPWRDTALAFNQQMVDAMDSINRYSAPLPAERHLLLFASSVIAVAGLLIHVIAVQIRQAAWAGLLLLTMYTVPAATVHGGLPALLFIPPAVGYIVLLSAEGRTRLSRWGRRISGVSHLDAAEPIEASALGQAGRRIGLSVVALAALLPALIPALPEGVIGNGLSGGSGGSGVGAVIAANDPMLDMGKNLKRGDNVNALTYTGGPADGTYLRLTVLDFFDGNAWRMSQQRGEGQRIGNSAVSPPTGYNGDLTKVPQSKLKVEVSRNFRSVFAPVPYPLRTISLKKNWKFDASALDVQSTNGQVVGGQDYNLTWYDLKPDPQALTDSVTMGEPDQVTSDLPKDIGRLSELAKEVTADANGNHYQQAVKLQEWFRSGLFTYNTATDSQSGMKALTAFLLDNKTGYCEQFATGMALLSRTLGIPSRVAVGFMPRPADKDNKHIIRMHDMHAWPELYFEGVGWVPFEPTPAARIAGTPDWTRPDRAVSPSPTTAPSTAPVTPGATEDPGIEKPNADRNLPSDTGLGPIGGGNWFTNGGGKIIGLVLAVILLLAIPWLIRTLTRRRRFSRPPSRIGIEGLWAEVRDTSRDLGLEWSEISTPRQIGDWLVSKLPEETHPQALRLARGVEAMRYAGLDDTFPDLRTEAEAVRKALWKDIRLVRRWRARLLPPSWRWYLNRGSSEASDLLDEFDLLLARIRSAVIPRRAN
jgi:transglutaminase-like putative cysteine protease